MFKKLLKTIVCLSLIATMILPTVANASYYFISYGDTNIDGLVDIGDVACMRAYIIGTYTPDNLDDFKILADANADGSVDIIDVVVTRSVIVGNIMETLSPKYIHEDGNLITINEKEVVLNRQIIGDLPKGVSYKVGNEYDYDTLTLNNVTINIDEEYGAGIFCDDDLEIVLIGDNYITASSPNAAGILCNGGLEFSGDGSLTISNMPEGYGIFCNLDISVIKGTQIAINNTKIAVRNERSIYMKNSTINIDNSEYGFVVNEFYADTSSFTVVADFPFTSKYSLYFDNSTVKTEGLLGLAANEVIGCFDSKIDIQAYDTFSSNVNNLLGGSIAMASGGRIEFENTEGRILGTDTVILIDTIEDKDIYASFKGTKFNSNYQCNTLTDSFDNNVYKYIVMTDGEPIIDGDDVGNNITNLVKVLDLEKSK